MMERIIAAKLKELGFSNAEAIAAVKALNLPKAASSA